jgi:hypothetical protein
MSIATFIDKLTYRFTNDQIYHIYDKYIIDHFEEGYFMCKCIKKKIINVMQNIKHWHFFFFVFSGHFHLWYLRAAHFGRMYNFPVWEPWREGELLLSLDFCLNLKCSHVSQTVWKYCSSTKDLRGVEERHIPNVLHAGDFLNLWNNIFATHDLTPMQLPYHTLLPRSNVSILSLTMQEHIH